jgi:hypothetical protein
MSTTYFVHDLLLLLLFLCAYHTASLTVSHTPVALVGSIYGNVDLDGSVCAQISRCTKGPPPHILHESSLDHCQGIQYSVASDIMHTSFPQYDHC